jgi:ferric-dicitrate binding protein FerR (iron transport regulator)
MPALQPIDRDVLTGLQHGDERALEQVFRARFEPLAQQASAALGDESAAPKVVESAFVRVWGEREHIDTPEALEAFLFDAVKSGAARERSRRAAAHRMGGAHPASNGQHATTHAAGAAVTLDDAWAHVTRALHTTGHSPKVQDELHAQLRHDAAVHVASLAKRPAWQVPTAIAVVLGLAIFGSMRWLDKASADSAVTNALASVDARPVSTLAAQAAATTLGDGSRVALAADTRLRIPPNYGSSMRAVQVDGAATITAVAAPERPLTIRVGDASINANGATVDVRGYPGEPEAALRVRSGQATIKSLTSGASQTVNAGQAVLLAGGTLSVATPAQVAESFGWADKKFVVNGKPLGDVLPQLVRFYGLELKVPDEGLRARPVSVDASLESSRDVIAAVEKAANAQFGYEGKTMVLTPKP